jgi:hypothetical protein
LLTAGGEQSSPDQESRPADAPETWNGQRGRGS